MIARLKRHCHEPAKRREYLTLIIDGGIRTQSRFLVVLALVLGQNGAGRGQTGDHVLLGQLKAEALGVVIDINHLGELERKEALVAASKCRLGGRLGDCDLAAATAAEVVRAGANDGGANGVDSGIAAGLGADLCGSLGCLGGLLGLGLLGGRRATLGRKTASLLGWTVSLYPSSPWKKTCGYKLIGSIGE